ncbi:channel accessory protein ArfB [Mycobacterium botniense]|uniref:Putative membrane protein ArfB n=1 Tax=Mycobacterium botniense TaxID=84962 RepID=A0A7I9XYA7_9MYCO|nr:hypothetical protein [Mycobacterium botniense]GFG74791.1 putative membrane protein ArfB [Mycobacterium botniense]
MDFIVQWLWYLLAFVAGSVVAWAIARISIPFTSKEQALADMPGSREIGER